MDLLRSGAVTRAFVNIIASTVFCLLAVFLGHLLAAGLNGGAATVAQIAVEEEA